MLMMRNVSFASCFVYSPSGACAASERSRLLRALLKAGNARFIFTYAVRVGQQARELPALTGFFDASAVLVPVPGSEPRLSPIASVTEHLAEALVREGLGRRAWSGLQRVRAVRKSATADPGERPTVAKHYDSFAVEPTLLFPAPEQFLLIDDVVTKGRTLLAAATRLREAFPRSRIRAFALLRTMGLIQDVNQLLDPCVGEIRWRAGDAHRNP
jgi:predicted amidophosphoribosyltransferase